MQQIIRANYEMTVGEAETVDGVMDGIEGDYRFYLLKMRDEKGWKALGYTSFEDYGEKRRGLAKAHLYRLASAAELQLQITAKKSPIGDKPIPETQLRPLKEVPPDDRKAIWDEATAKARAEGAKLTAKRVAEAVTEHQRSSAEWRGQFLAERDTKRDLQAEIEALKQGAPDPKTDAQIKNLESKILRLKQAKERAEREIVKERKAANERVSEKVDEARIKWRESSDYRVLTEKASALKQEIETLTLDKSDLEANVEAIDNARKALAETVSHVNELIAWEHDIPDEYRAKWVQFGQHMARTASMLIDFMGGDASEADIVQYLEDHAAA